MSELNVYWGDTHDNVFQRPDCPVGLEQNFGCARSHLDFYAPALYTADHVSLSAIDGTRHGNHPAAVAIERWKSPARLENEWQQVQEQTRAFHRPGSFVTFPGYEWQGDGTSGDHNVVFREEGGEIARVGTLRELYGLLRGREVIAIPHHTAYQPGARGKDWSVHDDELSPFVEIYSVHGSSETDEECCGLRQNPKMGPSVSGGTYQDALDRGCHVGAVCSTDGMGQFPGRHNWGLMACLAPELTRDALWESFHARRVYGVTGDRIRLGFTVNGACMGRRLASDASRTLRVEVVGSDALDRVEVLRNGRVIHTHAHQGTWDVPRLGGRSRFKLRVETGWGPFAREVGPQAARQWPGTLSLAEGGRFVGWEPCWTTGGQQVPSLDGSTARFAVSAPQLQPADLPVSRFHNANVFEFEARPEDPLGVEVGGLRSEGTVEELCRGSRVLWHDLECRDMLRERFGLDVDSFERPTFSHLLAHKAKLHRVIPETGYTAAIEIVDDEPLACEVSYRVRVEQRNGQRAWSSPVWVRPA